MSSTLESVYKTIIADHYKSFSSELAHFIDNNVVNANMNACYDNVSKMLAKFDRNKKDLFKERVKSMVDYDRCCESFNSLNNIRNNIVHGGTVLPSFSDLRMKYNDSIIIIEKLDIKSHERMRYYALMIN